jgi:acetate kinase
LSSFGLDLDPSRNASASGEATISSEASRARIFVIPADEERIVARATAEVVAGLDG